MTQRNLPTSDQRDSLTCGDGSRAPQPQPPTVTRKGWRSPVPAEHSGLSERRPAFSAKAGTSDTPHELQTEAPGCQTPPFPVLSDQRGRRELIHCRGQQMPPDRPLGSLRLTEERPGAPAQTEKAVPISSQFLQVARKRSS